MGFSFAKEQSPPIFFEPNVRGRVTNFLATDIRKQGMRRVDNSMHRKSRRLLKNIVILPVENSSHHTDNAKKCGAQKIADTLRTRMLGKSPVCQNSGVGKKGEMLESCQHHQQRGKKQISNRRQKNSFQPMLFARLARRTRERQPERFIYLVMSPVGVEPTTDCLGGSYSIQLSYGLMCLKPGDFKVFARFQCDSYGFILVLL